MPKFVFITHSAAPAGAELSLLRLAGVLDPDAEVIFTADGPLVHRFIARGLAVQVVTGKMSPGQLSRGRVNLMSVIRAGSALLVTGWRIGEKLRDEDAGVVVARSSKTLLVGWVASRRARVPLVWSVHDQISSRYFGKIVAPVIRALGRVLASGYIANSQSTLETLWTGDKPTVVIPPGLELRQHLVSPPAKSGVSEVVNFVAVGRIAPWKGQDVFIRAFASVIRERPGSGRATIVGGALFGESEYEESLKVLVKELGIESSVSFVGHVDDVYPYLESADVLVHSSVLPEPFGSVVIEGMATGCAVIATDAGGPAETITSGDNGLLVPCGDEEALACALGKLLEDVGLRDRLVAGGFQRANDFDIEVLANQTREWLDRLTVGVK
jgi:glycosyltransferase involved in cell wall biosynthesis